MGRIDQRYLRGFDTLRGFAAALVAMAHCWWATYPVFAATQLSFPFLAYGTKDVPIFAVLSGFLIYRSCLSAVKTVDGIRDYVVRRFFRIYPVYLLGVSLCVLTGQYAAAPMGSTPFGYFVSDLGMFTSLDWPGWFANPPAWSLYIEVCFYAVMPLMLLTVGQRRMVMASLILLVFFVAADYQDRIYVLWRYFFIGIVASEMSEKMDFKNSLFAFLVGLGLTLYDFGGPAHDWIGHLGIGLVHPDDSTLGLGLGIGLILASLPHLPKVSAVLNVLPLRLLGAISYSVYITQFFYIYANFPEIAVFRQAGSQQLYEHFKQLAPFGTLYFPFIFFPGVLFWGAVSFVLVERPGMIFGRNLLRGAREKRAAANLLAGGLPTSASEKPQPVE